MKSNFRVWYDGDPEYTYFDSLAQALKHIRKTKVLDEDNSGLEECLDGIWDEWMDSDDQEIHDHLYMYGGKSPYLKKVKAADVDPIRPSIMDTVSFTREDMIASLTDDEDEDEDEEENDEDNYDEIIDPEQEALDEESLDERLMNVIGVSPKTTTTEAAAETEVAELIGEDEMSEFDDEDEDDDLEEEDEEDES